MATGARVHDTNPGMCIKANKHKHGIVAYAVNMGGMCKVLERAGASGTLPQQNLVCSANSKPRQQ
eukprot:4955400-Pleurochrysis_carterae.AAC.1